MHPVSREGTTGILGVAQLANRTCRTFGCVSEASLQDRRADVRSQGCVGGRRYRQLVAAPNLETPQGSVVPVVLTQLRLF
ncbi:uncharacterized protein SPSK_02101 [Sporothrix schenckii 1099-18]|uniref:Uncharacterized protein n=1 Tax=Sporothrix schenckii 1099-18 TaxID=1397361 RepID=A0A0F2MBV3_SPOSC|nr:uncharacterized protein SPSK_02101 [Sporothrix schenckii 1099-18]KJR87183.1 hypothetical protein SPSK_02101 [Sporothrix schenckii 1099-18]